MKEKINLGTFETETDTLSAKIKIRLDKKSDIFPKQAVDFEVIRYNGTHKKNRNIIGSLGFTYLKISLEEVFRLMKLEVTSFEEILAEDNEGNWDVNGELMKCVCNIEKKAKHLLVEYKIGS